MEVYRSILEVEAEVNSFGMVDEVMYRDDINVKIYSSEVKDELKETLKNVGYIEREKNYDDDTLKSEENGIRLR